MSFIEIFNSWVTFLVLIGVGFALLIFSSSRSSKKRK